MTKNSSEDAVTALQRAVAFLARREHSRDELYWKLRSRDYDENEITEALQCLQERGLQSDDRFAEDYVQSHLQRGYGPYKLLTELKQRGVDENLAQRVVYSDEIDWFELAQHVVVKKYGLDMPRDFNDRAKRMRFLQQRGFSREQIQYVLESAVMAG